MAGYTRPIPLDLEVDNVAFTESITDAEQNTVTSLSDPVRVTEEASTFAESDVTVTHNNTDTSNNSIQITTEAKLVTVDDFEDGDISIETDDWTGWSGDTGSFSSQINTVLSGTYSGRLNVDNAQKSLEAVKGSAITPSRVNFTLRLDNRTYASESLEIFFGDSSDILRLDFDHDTGDIKVGSNTVQSWSANTTYKISISNIDYGSKTFDVYVDGVKQVSNESFYNDAASAVNNFRIRNTTYQSGQEVNAFIDDVEAKYGDYSSGDALIEWDSGVPADIDSYDLATFQRTLDGETITIDVEDGNGNVLYSDVGENFDISTIATDKNVKLRAKFSRNNTANNPTLDYAARRYTR